MKEYKVFYRDGKKLGMGDDWFQTISAETPEQAYREFVKKVGAFPRAVNVETGLFGDIDVFDDHAEEVEKRIEEEKAQTGKHPQESTDKENSNLDQPNIDAKTQDLDIEYQESGWATFLNICGVLNLILFVIGGIWMLEARSSDQFAAMNLTIIGLVAAINCFFFSFLVNIFTRIQHNTHQTTILLSKLIDKTETKDKT